MTIISLPTAAFGKCPRDAIDTGGGPRGDDYRVLFQTDDFPVVARKSLEDLAASVQWAGGGPAERYSDCFALWPIDGGEGGALMARLIDAGRDSLGRPHVLRVDAVYLAPTADPAAQQELRRTLAALLSARWPSESWAGPPTPLELTLTDGPSARFVLFDDRRPWPRLLIADHPHCRAQGFQRIGERRA